MRLATALLIGIVFPLLIADNADAVVCVRGAYHAGCVERYGAVHRYYHRGVVVRRRVY